MAFSMKPLNFCKLVYVSAITLTFSNVFETSGSPLILKMKPEDFEYILSWKVGNNSRTSACYTVMYTKNKSTVGCNLLTVGTELKSAAKGQEQVNSYNSRSQESQDSERHVVDPGKLPTCPAFSETDAQKTAMNYHLRSHFKTVQECTNITRPFCNLTNEFADFCEGNAFIIVQQDTSNGTNYSDILQFSPYTQRCLKPPQFNISVCQNCVNVTVKLPALLLKIYQKLDYTITVKTADLKENRIDNTTQQDSFFTILEDLHPNKNYCIAVQVSNGFKSQCTSTIPKCIILDSNNGQDYTTLSVLAPLLLFMVLVILVCLFMTGFISCKRRLSPNVLNIKPNMACSVFESDLEEICDAQVQESNTVLQDSEDEYSESDDESNFDTKCGIFNKITPLSDMAITQKLFTGSSATINKISRTLAENNQSDSGRGSPLTQLYPSEVNSAHVAESECTDCLNVDLNTVRITDEKLDSSTSDHEKTRPLNESCTSDAFEPDHSTEMPDSQNFDVQSALCSWENLSVSGESESSYSETECTSGYLRR